MKSHKNNFFSDNAAGRKCQRIFAQSMEASTLALFQNIPFRNGMHGLDLHCGIGEVTLKLKDRVGENGKMTGIDMDITNLKIAGGFLHENDTNISYRFQNIQEWKEEQAYHFIYSRFLFSQYSDPLTILKLSYASLKEGGFMMVEDLNVSQFHCFPISYAFDRFVELYTSIIKQQGIDENIGNRLNPLFHQAGFQNIQVQSRRPNFLTGKNKRIASLTLEHMAPILIDKKLSTTTELQVLIFELKNFEKQKNSMITLPGIYQVLGYRPERGKHPAP